MVAARQALDDTDFLAGGKERRERWETRRDSVQARMEIERCRAH